MDISIIIVNYNTKQLLSDCVESVCQKTFGIDYEIVIVDNGSDDTNFDALIQNERVHVVQSAENLGFGKANNLGRSVAKGDYLFFLNPDTLLLNNAVQLLFQYMKEHPEVGAVGGNLYNAEEKPCHSFSRLYPSITMEMDFAMKELISRIKYGKNRQFNYTEKPLEVAFITGADLMIRKDVFDRVGQFDKDFFMYYEDSALCRKIHEAGYKVMSVPAAKIIHLEGQSMTISEQRQKRIQEGRRLHFHKFYSKRYNRIADVLNKMTMLAAMAICKLSGKRELYNRYSCRYKIYCDVNS